MTAQEVSDLYDAQLPNFSEPTNYITGYTFEGDEVDYDGDSHNITVTAGQDAEPGVTVTYTCGGEPFTGATDPGIYEITATLSKEGFTDTVLTATLKINAVVVYGSKLIDLDFSTYVKDDSNTDPDTVAGNVGGVTNNGLYADSTMLKFKSHHGRWVPYDLTLESFTNMAGGTTYYLHEETAKDNLNDRNRFKAITETALETQANTITFWLNLVPQTRTGVQWNIIDYYAKYGGVDKHLFTVEQAGRGEGKCILTGRGETPSYGGIYAQAGDWVQIAITNPEYALDESDGKYKKTMHLYVNGEWRGQKVVEKPEGTLDDVKIGLLGEITTSTGKNWPQNASIADVQVFAGAFSKAEVVSLYANNVSKFMPGLTVKNSNDDVITNITGVAADDTISVEYNTKVAHVQLFAASYSADGMMLSVSTVQPAGEGALELSVPAEASKVVVYTWHQAEGSYRPAYDTVVLNR